MIDGPTYPEVIDRPALKVARVDARLRLAAIGAQEPEGRGAASFFVTGNRDSPVDLDLGGGFPRDCPNPFLRFCLHLTL